MEQRRFNGHREGKRIPNKDRKTLKSNGNEDNAQSILQTTPTVIRGKTEKGKNGSIRVLKLRNTAQKLMFQDPMMKIQKTYREAKMNARKTLEAKKTANIEKFLEEIDSNIKHKKTRTFFQEVYKIAS